MMSLNDPQIKDQSPVSVVANADRIEPTPQHARYDRYFKTGHLMDDLKGRSVRGGVVTVGAQGCKFLLNMASTMILARLLTPEDFGLVAMVTAVTGFVAMFKDAGLSMATVQREHVTQGQISTLFWVNVALSLAVTLLVALSSSLIARFYGELRLQSIAMVIAGTFVFSGLTVQHQALMRRQMQFGYLAIIEIVSMLSGGLTAVAMAWQGCGYWALVGMTMCNTIVNCLLVWILVDWRPGAPVRRSGARSMLRFGGGLTLFSFLNYVTRNSDNIVIGYALGGGSLGVYGKAFGLLMMPIQQINAPVASVLVPSLSRLQHDPRRYRHVYLRAIGMLSFVGMPLVCYLFVAADEVVEILLGSGWEETVSVFRWLAPAALFGTINVAPGWLCVSLGKTKVPVVWAAISAPATVATLLIGSHWGIDGVAAGSTLSWCILFTLFMVMACHRSPVTFFQVIWCLAGPFFSSVTSAIATFQLSRQAETMDLTVVSSAILKFVVFAAVYLTLSIALPSGRSRLVSIWRDGLAALTRSKTSESSHGTPRP